MKRLTYRVNIGIPEDVILVDHKSTEECMEWKNVLERLAYYEDLEEQGLLLKLPCKVGDTFYTIIESKVLHLRFDDCKKNLYVGGIDLYCTNVKNRCDYRWIHLPCEKFYVTQAEAEEALKKMEAGE